MTQPEFPIGFVERFCPLVQDAFRARSSHCIGPPIVTQADRDCAECAITIHCGWMHCENCELSCAPDSNASMLYSKQIEDYYEATNKEEQPDDVSQQAQERPEGNSAAELAASIGEALSRGSYLWSGAVIPYNDSTGTEGQEERKAVMEEKLTVEDREPAGFGEGKSPKERCDIFDGDEVKKHVCTACERRKQQTFTTLEGEYASVASKEELLSRLKMIVEGKNLYFGWATGIGKVIDLTNLSKEQAALLYFELKEYGEIKTRRQLHGGTNADD